MQFHWSSRGYFILIVSVAPLPQAPKLKLRCGLEQNKPYNAIKATSAAQLREINDVTLFMFFTLLEKHLLGIQRLLYFALGKRKKKCDVACTQCIITNVSDAIY